MKIKGLILENLLLPVISMILFAVISLINKKLSFVDGKKLVIITLSGIILIGISALTIFLGTPFLPYLYCYLFLFFLVVGYYYSMYVDNIVNSSNIYLKKGLIVLITLVILFAGSYIFSIVFNLCDDLQYGLSASTATFSVIIPMFFIWSYNAMAEIPLGIQKVWSYNKNLGEYDFTADTTARLVLLELELNKSPDNAELIKVKAKAPVDLLFGNWFQLFLNDYNSKYFEATIQYQNNNSELYGWIFYTSKTKGLGKNYIDPELSILENGLDNPIVINCKRVNNISY